MRSSGYDHCGPVTKAAGPFFGDNMDMILDRETGEEYEVDWSFLAEIEDPKPDYNNSGPLDIHLYSEDAKVEDAAKALCTEIGYSLDRAITHMKVVLLNLYWTHHLSPERWVGYSRDNNRYGMDFRYNRQRIEVHPLIKVVDGLERFEYVTPGMFYSSRKPGEGRCSRMRATKKLIKLLEENYAFTIDVVGRHPHEEVIFQKDKNKELVWYDDNHETPGMRKFLNEYNEFLQKTYIDVDYKGFVHKRKLVKKSAEYLDKLPTHLHFDLTKRKMRRIFNNNSFTQGGRFYGGFWMEMPSDLRLRLIINQQKVVEADYSGIHIHLLYSKIGIDYGKYKQDPYEIPGYPSTKEYRNLFKKLLLAAINAKKEGKVSGEQKAIQALQKDINFSMADYPSEIPDLKQIIKDFREHHEPIAKFLFTGEGLKLMYQDSQIAEYVMKSMYKLRIPVLPVHDSFICPKKYSEVLLDKMVEGYQHITGKKLKNIKYTVNIKEPDEWDRAKNNELFPDDGYYFDLQYTEDTALINHIIQREGYQLYDDEDEAENTDNGTNIKPHVFYVEIPIEHEYASFFIKKC